MDYKHPIGSRVLQYLIHIPHLLMGAVIKKNVQVVQLLIQSGIDIDAQGDGNLAIIMLAVESGSIEIVQLIIAAGIDLNSQNNDGITPLMRAVRQGSIDIVRALIAAGANIDIINNQRQTAMSLASTSMKKIIQEAVMQRNILEFENIKITSSTNES